MNPIYTRSKRRCTLHPSQLQKASGITNTVQPIEVIKHPKSNSVLIKQTAPQNPQDLPYFVIDEEDEDLEVVSANVKFLPHQHAIVKTGNHKKRNEVTLSKKNPLKIKAKIRLSNNSKVPEKFLSEIPFKQPHSARNLNKKDKQYLNKRSSSHTTSSSSNGSSEYIVSPKTLKLNKSKSAKKPMNIDKDNVVDSKKDATQPNQFRDTGNGLQLRKKVEETECYPYVNNQHNSNLLCNDANKSQSASASIKPGYAIVTESYIRNLKDEIHSARSKPSSELNQTADQLKAEINQFRNGKDTFLVPQKIHSTNTKLKITLPKDRCPNTLNLHITNSIHGASHVNPQKQHTQDTHSSCAPILDISDKGTITNTPASFEKSTSFADGNTPVNTLQPWNDLDRRSFPFQISEFLAVSSQDTSDIETQMAHDSQTEVPSKKQGTDYFLNTKLLIALPPDTADEKKTIHSVESEFRMTVSALPEDDNQSKQEHSWKGYEFMNSFLPKTPKDCLNLLSGQDMEVKISHASSKADQEDIQIEPPVVPVDTVCSPMNMPPIARVPRFVSDEVIPSGLNRVVVELNDVYALIMLSGTVSETSASFNSTTTRSEDEDMTQ